MIPHFKGLGERNNPANVASKPVGRRSSGESVIVKLHDGVSKTTG